MAPKNQAYLDRLKSFIDTIEIGEKVIASSKQIKAAEKQDMRNDLAEVRDLALNAEKEFQNLRSLAYLEDEFLTYWNESVGADTERFWQEVSKKKLPYERKDVLKDVLSRKKIKNEHEFNTIIDGFVIAQQIGKITHDEAMELSKYISDFEKKQSRRK